MEIVKLNCRNCLKDRCSECLNPQTCLCASNDHYQQQMKEVEQAANDSKLIESVSENLRESAKLEKNSLPVTERLKYIEILDDENVLPELVQLFSKTIKEENNLIIQIIFNYLSAWTTNPINLMITERTSEGKSYPAVEIAKSFPKEQIRILGNATTQSFKYLPGELVDKNYNSIQDKVEELDTKIESEKDAIKKSEYVKKRADIFKNSKKLIDFKNKSIIFKEPPDHRLIEALYPTLSHDERFNEHIQVNKGKKGENKGEVIVFKDYPSFLVCSAKDDTQVKRWGETKSRFLIVSPNVSKEKYKKGIDLTFDRRGLPTDLYEELVISEKDQERKKELILKLIKLVRSAENEIFNPFKEILAEIFPQEVGTRFRQADRFSSFVELHCKCFAHKRPQLVINGKKIPIVVLEDIKKANELTEDAESIPPYKIKWFNEIFLQAYTKKSTPITESDTQQTLQQALKESTKPDAVLRVRDIVDFVNENGGKTNTRQIRETFLNPLEDFGYIEYKEDPDNKKQYVYWPVHTKIENSQTPINSYSPITPSRVKSFLEKIRIERFGLESNQEKINVDQLVTILFRDENSYQTPNFEPKKEKGE